MIGRLVRTGAARGAVGARCRIKSAGFCHTSLRRRPPPTSASSTMLNLASRSSQAWRSIQRLAKGMATVSERIGDTKVPMSLLETGAYINYQRIEDNLAIVRDRYFS